MTATISDPSERIEALRKKNGGRRRKADTYKAYPTAEHVHDGGLVGRREILLMAGYNPESSFTGSKWFHHRIDMGAFPPADGQVVDGRPTWQRSTMLVFLYQLTNHLTGKCYLIPELWPEAEALLGAQRAGDMLDGVAAENARPQGGFRA